tara:strand:+ start:762 stop:1004 length:243 start_codon:yes stop_codon:yes gene_type:complete
MNKIIGLMKNLLNRQEYKPLGRWCHPGYSIKCDIERKADLANMDNSLCYKIIDDKNISLLKINEEYMKSKSSRVEIDNIG